MDFFIKTKKQRELYEKLNELIPAFREREEELDKLGSFPFQNIKELKEIGYHTITLPKKYGGQGLGLYELVLGQETIARGCGSTSLSIGWHVGLLLEYAENNHWDEKTAHWLLQDVKNGALINVCATESNAGSPTRGALPRTTAILDGDEWVITGEKTYTSMAPVLDYFLVTATCENDTVETFVIPKEQKGVSISNTWDMLAMRGTASDTLILDHVRIPKSYILKNSTKKVTANGRHLHIPACYLGIAAAARDYAISFAANYTPLSLGKPIAEVPAITQSIGEIELQLKKARHMLYSTAEQYDRSKNKETFQEQISIVKVVVTHAAMAIVDQAMKIVGSRALSASNPMHRYYLNVRASLYNPPMEDIVIEQLATKAINEQKNNK